MTLQYLHVYFWYYCYEVSMQNQLDVEKGYNLVIESQNSVLLHTALFKK